MGKRSTRENKNIYQLSREGQGLTRETASERMVYISPERIEKIENDRIQIRPEDVKLLAEYYKAPGLCNYYCSQECPIGQGRMKRVESRELVQIAVELLNGMNRLQSYRDRLLEIVEDGTIDPDEYEDFARIKETLDKIQASVSTLQLWLEEKKAEGEIEEDAFS